MLEVLEHTHTEQVVGNFWQLLLLRLIYIILMTGVLLERANSIIPAIIAAAWLKGL